MRRLLEIAAIVSLLATAISMPAAAQPASPDPHAAHKQQKPAPPAPPADSHDQHQHAEAAKPGASLPPFIPPVTDEDREAAFPDVAGHSVHDRATHYFVLIDQFEWQGGTAHGMNVDSRGWIGGDRDRLWFRAEGDADADRVGEMNTHVLFGRRVSRWWDLVGGVRQDLRPGDPQTWAAVGLQGIAPYWFEIEATAYVGGSGRTALRLATEYEVLITNRIVLQPLVELELSGKSDPDRGMGAGLNTTDAGLRLRYEFRREIAPYVGVTWHRKYGGTADFAATDGEATAHTRMVAGLRIWF